MADREERLGVSRIQHGRDSDRIYLMELDGRDMPGLVGKLDALAVRHGYSKVFAKVPGRFSQAVSAAGYTTEALIPAFFDGADDGHFMSRFLATERALSVEAATIEKVLLEARARPATSPELPSGYELRACNPDDAKAMAALYRLVFQSYPFPIGEPRFLLEAMGAYVTYFAAFRGRELVALAASERYPRARNAEMTDFATHPSCRGQGLARALLSRAEAQAQAAGDAVTFTIARALSPGMNLTFARGGYSYAGTLINNTQIAGRIESMNVWYKPARPAKGRHPHGGAGSPR